jgi:hypothetical protein
LQSSETVEVHESSFPKLIRIRMVNVFCQLSLRGMDTDRQDVLIPCYVLASS